MRRVSILLCWLLELLRAGAEGGVWLLFCPVDETVSCFFFLLFFRGGGWSWFLTFSRFSFSFFNCFFGGLILVSYLFLFQFFILFFWDLILVSYLFLFRFQFYFIVFWGFDGPLVPLTFSPVSNFHFLFLPPRTVHRYTLLLADQGARRLLPVSWTMNRGQGFRPRQKE